MRLLNLLIICSLCNLLCAQDYFFEKYKPFLPQIPSPEQFLGYEIGARHTRHDLIVAYLEKLAEVSDRATLRDYGRTHEGRKLVMLTVSSPGNLSGLEGIKARHLQFTDPEAGELSSEGLPVFINLAYNVHGNEPSSSEAALLTAYTLVASDHAEIARFLDQAVIFIDPAINPDGRDRHTQWANSYQGTPLVSDPQDAEHNEYWPGGRTNHYWFDLNRDWLLAIHPESRAKLNWYHEWYPNVVTDFHEMGTQNTYFFEPMKVNGSLDPIMPRENYDYLNPLFGTYFAKALDSIGSLYFTREAFDGTYPGYGSSYPDLQGGLGLLFEQASSRGHAQKTAFGEITFPFTIRNQYVSSLATVRAAVENKDYLYSYQQDFFKSALTRAGKSRVKGYSFEENEDKNRLKAFIDKLLVHKIKVYETEDGFVVPTRQPQYRMVQSVFETYKSYRDSVFYDASAWSLANFYNISYRPVASLSLGERVTEASAVVGPVAVPFTTYAYLIDWQDYNAPAILNALQTKGMVAASAFKPFTAVTNSGQREVPNGTLVVPVSLQGKEAGEVHRLIREAQEKWQVPVYWVQTGLNLSGIDLGSSQIKPLKAPVAAMFIGQGVSAYEAGEVWHLLDQRVGMPITKIPLRNFKKATLDSYSVLVMVSGTYDIGEEGQEKIASWVKKGNTLITIGTASEWAVEKKLVDEELTKVASDSLLPPARLPYGDADDNMGKMSVGGIIVSADLDRTHPLAFGYRDTSIPVYKNNEVWLAPSKNAYSTVAKYSSDPHIDGFITEKNLEGYLMPSVSLLVSRLGEGRVVLFADNPNFRGSWYGTNRLFLNALFLGQQIDVPQPQN